MCAGHAPCSGIARTGNPHASALVGKCSQMKPPQNLVAPAPTDPLVERRNANAKANAEYSASKKASKAELKAQTEQAKAQYKEEVKNAKINRKADKDAAKAELNATEPNAPKDTGLQH